MKRIALLLLALPATALANDVNGSANWCELNAPHAIDVRFDAAIEAAGGVDPAMLEAIDKARDAWDGELNHLYKRTMARLGKSVRADALRKAQRAWVAWDEAESGSNWLLAEDGGSAGRLGVASQSMARRRTRACDLYVIAEQLEDERGD